AWSIVGGQFSSMGLGMKFGGRATPGEQTNGRASPPDGRASPPGRLARPWLLVATPHQQLTRVDLGEQPLRIGRAPGNGLVLADQYASSSHAELVPAGDGWAVRDLGSSNGTLLNGRRLVSGPIQPLRDGDTLTIGESQLTY